VTKSGAPGQATGEQLNEGEDTRQKTHPFELETEGHKNPPMLLGRFKSTSFRIHYDKSESPKSVPMELQGDAGDKVHNNCDNDQGMGSFVSKDLLLSNATADGADIARVFQLAKQELLQHDTMSKWLLSWCTEDVVRAYMKGCNGDLSVAASKLVSALQWREKHKEVLLGLRIPKWQGDMRVLDVDDRGHPLILLSFSLQPRHVNPNDAIDHLIAVIETAVKSMRYGAFHFDMIVDCYGFSLRKNIDPRPACATAELLKLPYRGRLRHGFIVDAPSTFGFLWKIASPLMAEATRNKIRFVSMHQAVDFITNCRGSTSGQLINKVLCCNRDANMKCHYRVPSELA